jgi:hypothetical protein
MRKLIVIILLLCFGEVYSQNHDFVSVELFKNGSKIRDSFKIRLVNSDTVFLIGSQTLAQGHINIFSVEICYDNVRLSVPKRNDTIKYIKIYLDKKTFKKFAGKANFGYKNPFKKYYYIDLGLDVFLRTSRFKKKYCKPSSV